MSTTADFSKFELVAITGPASNAAVFSKFELVVVTTPASATAPKVRKKVSVRGRLIYLP
jgi:hypothetical protein